jgi:vancomycin resistance protein VanJ
MAQSGTAAGTGRRWRVPGTGRWGRDAKGRSTWRRGWVVAVLAVLVACLLAFHAEVPDSFGNFGSLLETFLPWVGLAVPVLLAPALLRRSATALVALLLPTLLWVNLFGALLTDKSGGAYDFTVGSTTSGPTTRTSRRPCASLRRRTPTSSRWWR